MDDREAQRERLRDKLEERAYRDAAARAVTQLSGLLHSSVSAEQALPRETVQTARQAYLKQLQYHLVWRRVWGVHLRDEMLEIAQRLAAVIRDRVILVWVIWDVQARPIAGTAVAFDVPAVDALTGLPQHVGPPPGEVGPGGVGSDLLLVNTDGTSGVNLDYQHHADRDEYEMLVWGAYARPLVADRR
jgi:hypothetical protein